jgi:hypothetical protein
VAKLPSLYNAEDAAVDERTRASDELRLAPRAAQSAWLLVVSGQQSVGRFFEVKPRMTIGRAGADIALEEEGVSKVHAQVELLAGGAVRVSDLGSSNGIRVEGRLMKVASLREGQRLRLGNAVLTLVHLDDARAVIAANLRASSDAIATK